MEIVNGRNLRVLSRGKKMNKREKTYSVQSDKLMYKFLEKLAASDPDGQKWLAEKAKIRQEIK